MSSKSLAVGRSTGRGAGGLAVTTGGGVVTDMVGTSGRGVLRLAESSVSVRTGIATSALFSESIGLEAVGCSESRLSSSR